MDQLFWGNLNITHKNITPKLADFLVNARIEEKILGKLQIFFLKNWNQTQVYASVIPLDVNLRWISIIANRWFHQGGFFFLHILELNRGWGCYGEKIDEGEEDKWVVWGKKGERVCCCCYDLG